MEKPAENPIILRALEPEDLNLVFEMENRSEARLSGECRIPYSYEFLRSYIASSLTENFFSNGQLRLIASELPPIGRTLPREICESGLNDSRSGFDTSRKPHAQHDIGIVDFFHYDAFSRHAELGILVLPPFRNRGLGEKILRLASDYAENRLNLHQLYAEVLADNLPSLNLFEKAGFSRCGCKKEWFGVNGSWKDVWMFQQIYG